MSDGRRWRGRVVVGVGIACVVGAGACVDGVPGEDAAGGLVVTTVPTPAHLVSGGPRWFAWSCPRTRMRRR